MPFIGNKPSAVPLTSADITDGIIVNADIANSTINLTTKVTGTLPVANGGTGLAALGTANQVLAVNSGATALAYTSVSSDFVLLATSDITSSTASASFDGYFSSTYKNYFITFSQIKTVSNAYLWLRVRQSNADLTASCNLIANYSYYNTDTSGGQSYTGQIGASHFRLGHDSTSSTNDATRNGFFYIFNPLSSSGSYKMILGETVYFDNTASRIYNETFSGLYTGNTNALSGITFLASTGNISLGNFKLYGLK
jgi:hypothetical protein